MDTLGNVLIGLAALLLLASHAMQDLRALRRLAGAAALVLLAYGALMAAAPLMLGAAALLVLNAGRLLQLQRRVRAIEATRVDAPLSDWLLPHMQRQEHKAGDLLWRQGEPADTMVYLAQGELLLVEHAEILWPDSLVGELGLFAPDSRRSMSLRCRTDCTIYTLTSAALQRLHLQSPKLGFHVMRLIVARLMHDVEKAHAHGSLAESQALA
jgi:CRP-like cAMP-binding protein